MKRIACVLISIAVAIPASTLAAPKPAKPSKAAKAKPRKLAIQISIGTTPGIEVPPAVLQHFAEQLELELKKGEGYVFVSADAKPSKDTPKGFGLRGAITERKVEAAGTAGTKIALVGHLRIATWPEGRIRAQYTAKADATAKGNDRLELIVLDALIGDLVHETQAFLAKQR